jgi:hypothetical protein
VYGSFKAQADTGAAMQKEIRVFDRKETVRILEWISVDERLPAADERQYVLIAAVTPEGKWYVSACSYLPDHGGFKHYKYRVTHWAPMPGPPD